MTTPAPDDVALVARWSGRKQARPLVVLLALAVLYAVGLISGVLDAWLAVVGLVLFGGLVVLGVVVLLRGRTAGPVLRLDADGVTVGDHPVVPWADLAEVRVSGLRPRLLSWAGGRLVTVVALVGRPGVDLPQLPHSGQPPYAWSRALTRRLYGSPLTVVPSSMTVSTRDLLAAVDRFSGGRVSRKRGPSQHQ